MFYIHTYSYSLGVIVAIYMQCGSLVLIVSFRYDFSVMILLRIGSYLSKIIAEASYPKLTIKPHKLHYKYNLLVLAVD